MKIGVVGGSGYAGGELLRILINHPEFEITYVSAGANAGELVSGIHPNLFALAGRLFEATEISKINQCDLVFLALPHGESSRLIPQIDSLIKIVDLGADYRLASADNWEKYYGGTYAGIHTYGLPEITGNRTLIEQSSRVANPGCYATSIILAIAPVVSAGVIDASDVVAVSASGTTGAGRSANITLSASEVGNNMGSYKFGGVHQHIPEIEEVLTKCGVIPMKLSFTPILAPMPRGILSTVTAKLTSDLTLEAVREMYDKYYRGSSFIKLLPTGSLPQTSSVNGTNYATVQVAVDTHTNRLIVSIAIDNLGKGAAGQAIQNANLMCGLPETTGLISLGAK